MQGTKGNDGPAGVPGIEGVPGPKGIEGVAGNKVSFKRNVSRVVKKLFDDNGIDDVEYQSWAFSSGFLQYNDKKIKPSKIPSVIIFFF